MTITMSAEKVREMLTEAQRFSSDLYIIKDVDDAEKEPIPERKKFKMEAIVQKACVWTPRTYQVGQLEVMFELASKSIRLRAKENIENFQDKYGIIIEGF